MIVTAWIITVILFLPFCAVVASIYDGNGGIDQKLSLLVIVIESIAIGYICHYYFHI